MHHPNLQKSQQDQVMMKLLDLKKRQQQEILPFRIQKIEKNEPSKRFFIRSMPNWLKPKLLERSAADTIDQLYTLASQ